MGLSVIGGAATATWNVAAYNAQDYKTGSNTWGDAIRAMFAATLAGGGGRMVLPPGQVLNVDQAGHAPLLQLPNDGNNGANYPARTRGPIIFDWNGSTLVLGANTRRIMDPIMNANYDWFRDFEFCNGIIDATAVPALATNEHVLFGVYNLASPSPVNLERFRFRNMRGFGLVAGGTGGTAGRKHWIALAPSPIYNDTIPIYLRENTIEDCDFKGGDSPFVMYASSPVGGTFTQPTDMVNAYVEDCHVIRLEWDSGYTPTAFNSGGAQIGGYALSRRCSVKDSYLKGAGDVALEVDNAHGVEVDNVTAENAWNSGFLPSSFGANDADQRNQGVIFRNCRNIVSDNRLISNQGFTAYTILHHRLGTVIWDNCRHESVALRQAGGGSAWSAGLCVSTTLTADVVIGAVNYNVATTRNIVVGEDVHIGTGSGTTGEWVTVASITSATVFVGSAAVNAYDHTNAAQNVVVQPTPSERLVWLNPTTREVGWNLPAGAAAAILTPIEVNHANALVVVRNGALESQGTTIVTAGALSLYMLALNGRNLTWDIDGFSPKADMVYGGAQGNYRAVSFGHLASMQPLTGRGKLRGLRPNVVSGFPSANATGLYIPDRTAFLLDQTLGALLLAESNFAGLPLGASEVTWQTAGENSLNVLLAEDNRPRSFTTWPRTLRLREDFESGSSGTNLSIGSSNWRSASLTSGGSAAKIATQGHPGVERLDSGATAGNIQQFTNSDLAAILHSLDYFDLYTWFNIPALTAASHLIRLGLSSGAGTDPPVTGYWLEKAAAGTNWLWVTSVSSVQTATDSGVVVASGWHQLRIRHSKESGVRTVGFTLDGGAEVKQTTNLPAVGGMLLFAQVGNGVAAASRQLDIDLVDLVVPNLVR